MGVVSGEHQKIQNAIKHSKYYPIDLNFGYVTRVDPLYDFLGAGGPSMPASVKNPKVPKIEVCVLRETFSIWLPICLGRCVMMCRR